MDENFVRDYEIDLPPNHFRHLPSLTVSGYSTRSRKEFSYNIYYRPDILDYEPSYEEVEEMKQRLADIRKFQYKLRGAEELAALEKERRESIVRQKRRSDMVTFLKENGLQEQYFAKCPTFKSFSKIAKPLASKGAKTRLLTMFKKQLVDLGLVPKSTASKSGI